MGLKEGTTAFLKLEDFEPPWRQAVLLANPGSVKKLIFAVRVTATETRSAESSGFSFFECSEEKFMLVEGQQSQIRNNCPRELRGLEVAPQRIFAAGKETLEQSPDCSTPLPRRNFLPTFQPPELGERGQGWKKARRRTQRRRTKLEARTMFSRCYRKPGSLEQKGIRVQEKIEEGGPPKVGRAISSSRKRQPAAKERKLLPVAWKPFFNRTLPQVRMLSAPKT